MYKYFHFDWPLHTDGYEIESVELMAGLLSTTKWRKVKFIVPIGKETEIYQPLKEYSGLFQTFAGCGTSEKEILDFANRYGLLFAGDNNLASWRGHIKPMRMAVEAWKSGKNERKLSTVIETALKGNVDLRFDPVTLQYQLWPKDLLTAMWAQFADAITGDKIYKSCEWCGTPFEINPRIARKNRIFCSNACKQADYRDRRSKS